MESDLQRFHLSAVAWARLDNCSNTDRATSFPSDSFQLSLQRHAQSQIGIEWAFPRFQDNSITDGGRKFAQVIELSSYEHPVRRL